MRKSLLVAMTAGIAFSEQVFVGSVPGVKLYEEDRRGQLTFTLENRMKYPLTFYAIETWATSAPGPPLKCSIREGAYLEPGSKLVIANKCALALEIPSARTIAHASRIVEAGFANGWRFAQAKCCKLRSS